MQLKQLDKFAVSLCSELKVNKIDVKDFFNSELTLEQNKAKISKIIKELGNGKATEKLNKYYANMKAWVRMISKGYINGLVCISEGGWGKTHNVLDEIKKILKPNQYEYINSYATPVEFVNWLYENRNKEVLVLDDIEGLLNDRKGVSILKAIMWSVVEKKKKQIRILHYLTTSKTLKAKVPFTVKARFVLLMNEIPKNKIIASLVTRCVKHELNFSYPDKMKILSEIAKIRKIPKEIVDYIRDNTSEATENLNIRTLIQIYSAYRYNKDTWKKMANSLLENNQDLELLKTLIDGKQPIKEQIKEFMRKTGKSRATYFLYKRRLN